MAMQNEWISVKEQMPDPGRLVIIAYGRTRDDLAVCQGRFVCPGTWDFDQAWKQDTYPVRFWMPMPEPPKHKRAKGQ